MTHNTTTHNTTTHHRTRRRLTAVAICIYCGNDMIHGTSCSEEPIRIRGVDYTPIRWGDEMGYPFADLMARCGDCGVPKGAVHHHGCDLEECPACKGQMLSCGCTDEAEETDQVEEDDQLDVDDDQDDEHDEDDDMD